MSFNNPPNLPVRSRRLGQTGSSSWTLPIGLLLLAAVWLGPLSDMARSAFSPGMITHLAVVALAGPLIACGIVSLTPDWKLGRATQALVCATLFDMLVVLGWHLPILHDAAARSWMAFSLEQISFLAAALSVWVIAIKHPVPLVGALALFMIFMHMTVLGCVLAISSRLLYDPEVCRGAFGFSPLEDQRFGGVLMASWGALAYALGALVLFLHAMRKLHTD